MTRKPTDASLQSFIPASEAAAFRETATASNTGDSLAIVSKASSPPVQVLHKFHGEDTWLNALKDIFSEAQALKVHNLQKMVQFFGQSLFQNQVMLLTIKLVQTMSKLLNADTDCF